QVLPPDRGRPKAAPAGRVQVETTGEGGRPGAAARSGRAGMSRWTELARRFSGPWRTRRRGKDFERELASHLELEAEEQRESGLSPEQARDAARRAFGNTTLVTEDVRAVWTARWVDGLARDTRYAARTFRKSPGFVAVAVLTLALGMGANTAIFTALNALMLRPLPFREPDELVRLYATKNGVASAALGGPSPPDARDYARANHSFRSI